MERQSLGFPKRVGLSTPVVPSILRNNQGHESVRGISDHKLPQFKKFLKSRRLLSGPRDRKTHCFLRADVSGLPSIVRMYKCLRGYPCEKCEGIKPWSWTCLDCLLGPPGYDKKSQKLIFQVWWVSWSKNKKPQVVKRGSNVSKLAPVPRRAGQPPI